MLGSQSCCGSRFVLGAEGAQGSLRFHSSVPRSCRSARYRQDGAAQASMHPDFRGAPHALRGSSCATGSCTLPTSPPLLRREPGTAAAWGMAGKAQQAPAEPRAHTR